MDRGYPPPHTPFKFPHCNSRRVIPDNATSSPLRSLLLKHIPSPPPHDRACGWRLMRCSRCAEPFLELCVGWDGECVRSQSIWWAAPLPPQTHLPPSASHLPPSLLKHIYRRAPPTSPPPFKPDNPPTPPMAIQGDKRQRACAWWRLMCCSRRAESFLEVTEADAMVLRVGEMRRAKKSIIK
jgi:hypothetical protein